MVKKINWKTFVPDLIRIEIGFAIFAFAIIMMKQSNLGTSAWAVLDFALSGIFHIEVGYITVIIGFIVLIGAIVTKEPIGWGTLANILSIGPWENFSLRILPPVTNNLPVQIAMLLGAILLMGLASAIYIGVDAGAGPRDSLMLAIKRLSGVSIRISRGIIEVAVVIIGALLGGPVGIGTVVFALLIGPSVQWGFKLLHVTPHRELEAELEDI